MEAANNIFPLHSVCYISFNAYNNVATILLCSKSISVWLCQLSPAIRFGRMPQSEKLKLKAELVTGDREEVNPQLADQKTLAKQIYDAYLKNFNMNKSKARTILTGKTSNPVCWLYVVGWWLKGSNCV